MSQSIRIIGWSTAVLSIIIILSETFNLFANPIEQMNMAFNMLPQAKSSFDAMSDILQYSRIWSVYTILYFLFVLSGSIQFIRFKKIGRMILEIACWIGIVNAFIDSYLSYLIWEKMQSAFSTIMGTRGMSLGNLNPIGRATIVLGFLFWIIPTIGMILYLRRPALKALMK